MNTKIYALFIAFCFSLISLTSNAQCPESFHDFSALDIHGDTLDMSSFAGKKVLVVNTASFCGYTPQYAQLQDLYDTYGGTRFEIIGFPANNFGNQEPFGEDSIIGVCQDYNITFTMMSKVSVTGSTQHPIYQWLTKASRNCEQNANVTWNFQKFMINEDGSWHSYASPSTSPLTARIVNWITAPVAIGEPAREEDVMHAYASVGTIHIETTAEFSEVVSIRLMNSAGQQLEVLYEGRLQQHTELPYSSSATRSGLYILEVSGARTLFRKKLILL